MEPPSSPTPNKSQTNEANLSPQKRRSDSDANDSSCTPIPQKRSKSEDTTLETSANAPSSSGAPEVPLPTQPPRRGLIVRDFHLQSVISLQPKPHRTFPEAPPLVSLTSEDQQLQLQQQMKDMSTDTTNTNDNNNTTGKEKQSKKKRKNKNMNFTESDFDSSDFTGTFPELGISLHCLTSDHCCDDKDERTALRMLCPTDPRPMRPSVNDKKLFGKEAIKRVAGTLAVTRALGDGYLKISCLR